MAEPDLSLAALLQPSPDAWIEVVLDDFAAFLSDHASAEKKASGMALNVAAHYPDQPALVAAMVDLAVEELTHYRQVMRLILARGLVPGADVKDPYVNELNLNIRRGTENFLLDRLLVGAVVERRGAERFGLVAEHAEQDDLAQFYNNIADSEERHWSLFIDLALKHCAPSDVGPRFNELTDIEAKLIERLPLRPALH